jgi:hypothetical protein
MFTQASLVSGRKRVRTPVTVTVSLSAYDGVIVTFTLSLSAYDDESSNPYPQWVRIWRLLGASPVRERFKRQLRTLRSVAQALALLNLQSGNIDCKEGSIDLSCEHEVSVGWQTD